MTGRETEVLVYIRGYAAANHGRMPSFAEIGEHAGLRSKGNVHRVVNNLKRKGFLTYLPAVSRSIRLTAQAHSALGQPVDRTGFLVAAVEEILAARDRGDIQDRHWQTLSDAFGAGAGTSCRDGTS